MSQEIRDTFIFYRSFYEMAKEMSDAERLSFFDAICEYALNFKEVELKGIAKICFIGAKPNISANTKRYQNGKLGAEHGKKGGRPKTPKKPLNNPNGDFENNPKETPNKDKDVNKDKDLECKLELESQFESFWQSYNPIHTGKGNKEKSKQLFLKALKKDTLEKVMKGLDGYMSHCHAKNSYTKSVEVWLKNESWNDEYSQSESKPLEVKSQKEIWTEKILKSPKPTDYEEVMKVAKIEAEYKYFENDKFYFLAENEAIKTKCKERAKEIELELFKLKNNQCQVFIIERGYFDGK